MNFVNYARMAHDVRLWSSQLPPLAAVVGVPRSGLIVAAKLAVHRNCHLLTPHDLRKLSRGHRPFLRRGKREMPKSGVILVVDDSANTGATVISYVKSLPVIPGYTYKTATLYHSAKAKDLVDMSFRIVHTPRIFEWNVFHSKVAKQTLFDMDGVLCYDPEIKEPDGDVAMFLDHLAARPSLYVPTVPIRGIVTSRLPRSKDVTMRWLKSRGVKYSKLLMSPHATAAARRQAKDSGTIKGRIYRDDTDAQLFIESHQVHAEEIHRVSKRPVLCIQTMKLLK